MHEQQVMHVEFRQKQTATFRQLRISQTVLLCIRSGTKIIRDDTGFETQIEQGEFAFLRQGENLTIGNRVGATGTYFAEGLIIGEVLIAEYIRHHPNPATTCNIRNGAMSVDFQSAFTNVVQCLLNTNLPVRVFHHRVNELLIWLEDAGISHRAHMAKSLVDRLQALLNADLERLWRAPDAAHALGMSEATLRRALSREATSFSKQLQDARLSFALMRIQTTNHPLSEIAYESGYSSQSRLNEAFKSRFDLSPGKLRAGKMQCDRIA